MDSFLEQAAEEAVGSNYGPAGGKFASKDIRVCSFSPVVCLDIDSFLRSMVEAIVVVTLMDLVTLVEGVV